MLGPSMVVILIILLTSSLQDWELRLVSVQSWDSGEYRCQATTHPPSFIAATLSVVGE